MEKVNVQQKLNFVFFSLRDLKMSTGDWFFDERVNRYSTVPGHDLVRVSLRKRPLGEYRKQMPDSLILQCELERFVFIKGGM